MRTEVSQPPDMAPGFARVALREAPAFDPATLEIAVESPARRFLQDRVEPAWGGTQAWLRPEAAAAGAEGIELTLGPDRTWHLRPNVTYVLHLRDAARTEPADARMAWIGIRLPSEPPPREPPAAAPEVPPAAPPGPPRPLVADPPAPRVVPPAPPAPRGSMLAWIAVGLLLLALAGIAAAWFLSPGPPAPSAGPAPPAPPPAAEPPPAPLGVASARAYLQGAQDGPTAFAEAQRYLKAGTPDAMQGALLLLNRAAEAGSAPAQVAIGRMYDPDGFSPAASAMSAPDPAKALLWYERAAKANDPDGLYRLGKLLASGSASAPGLGPDEGKADLQKAAQLGSKEAQTELDALRGKPN